MGDNGNGRFDELFQHALNGIYRCTAEGEFLAVNPALVRMLGYSDERELRKARLPELFASDKEAGLIARRLEKEARLESMEVTLKGKDGPLIEAILNARSFEPGKGGSFYHEGIITDITRIKRNEARLMHMATHDPLTGLYNRREFSEILERHLSRVRRYGNYGALLWMDLDGFKQINDGLGHDVGDELLTSIAFRMKSTIRESDVLARLGGDEFAVLYPNVDQDQAKVAAHRLLDAIRKHTAVVRGQSLRTTASMGVVLFPAHGTSASELLMKADMAMYRAKEGGRNRFTIYSPDDEQPEAPESRVDWLRAIREALETGGFVLYGQPILDLKTDRIIRYEVLLRLRGRDGKIIPPGSFLDVAEQFGLSGDIDRWVLGKVIGIISDASLPTDISFAVNLSPRSLTDGELLSMISGEKKLSVIGPVRLVVEITETAAIYNIHIAYQLKNLDVDYLKIDGSFVRNLSHDPVDKHLVLAMVHLASGLGKRTIAEFVEDGETLEILREIGVDCAQGFFIGRPRPLEEILAG